ncbi:MAG: hypothetical protein RUDDFDWM_001869 [Candidatus Fervidibacterota bacterium]
MPKIGYDDTPFLPGTRWRVHDGNRPQPPVVRPGTFSTQEKPGEPPSDAIILFDGTDLSKWRSCVDGGPARWKVENGYMEVVPGTGDIETIEQFGDCQLHIEWQAPPESSGEGQARSNSGVFLMGRYEVQVLDCYNNITYPDGTTGAIYGQYPPLVNACRPPGEWQVYDIIWEAPRFDGDRLIRPAYITVLFNGVVIHNHTPLYGRTTHRQLPRYEPHPPIGPLRLQDHGDRVRFRNIWYRPLKGYDEG